MNNGADISGDFGRFSWPILLAVAALTGLVVAVFFPIIHFEFIDLDVRRQVIDNPSIRGLSAENLKQIFTARGTTSSYYPIRSLTYAIDYQIWGLNPGGFKLTNGLIHLANVLLAFSLALRLLRYFARVAAAVVKPGWQVAAAAVSAAVLAIHPVVVEPVTWVGAREELLMTLGALGCLHFHLSARWIGERGGPAWRAIAYHVGAAVCCAAACLSNAVGAVIPVLVTAGDLLAVRRLAFRKIALGTAALWAIGAATVAIKKLGEYVDVPGMAAPFSLQRLMLVLKVYWLNLKALAWPTDLAVSHTWFPPQRFTEPQVILGGIALGLTGLVLWTARKQKLALLGLVWFGLALGPTAQIMPHHLDRADRFLYLPLSGLVVAFAWAVEAFARHARRRQVLAMAIAASVLAVLGWLSAAQVQTWRNNLTVWENCLRLEPENPQLHCGYADSLAARGEYCRAIEEYERSIQLDPESDEPLERLARLLTTRPGARLADHERAVQLSVQAFRLNRSCMRTLAMALGNLAGSQAAGGLYEPAIENYRQSLELWYRDEAIVLRFALLLATCPREDLRNPPEAVRLAEQACNWSDRRDANSLSVLARAYASAERWDEAAAAAEAGLEQAREAGNAKLAGELKDQLDRYRRHDAGG